MTQQFNSIDREEEEELSRVTPIPLESLDDLDTTSDSHSTTSNNNNNNNNTTKKKSWIIPTLYKFQKYSAYSFVSFLGIHVSSVIIVPILPIDQGIKDEVFSMAKAIYQSIPLYESICIFGSVSIHLLSGIGIRIYRKLIINNNKKIKRDMNKNSKERFELNKIKDDDDDIGFGGLSNLFGLGYKKSFTVKYFKLTPLQFSGYLLIPFLLFHGYKFRFIPWEIEGDSSLINLEYISYVLNLKHPLWNTFALCSLIWIMAYHSTNGLLKLQNKYSKNWKKIGLSIVNGMGFLGMFAVYLFKNNKTVIDINGFLGKSFAKYLHSFWV
ncbi:MAG: MCP1 family protein [Asgard group archaeon]|nr:MCP1 family protein [Asgard group archaeon]